MMVSNAYFRWHINNIAIYYVNNKGIDEIMTQFTPINPNKRDENREPTDTRLD